MKKVNLFLDDLRFPKMSHNENRGLGLKYSDTNTWVIVRDYFEFIDYVEKNFDNIGLISFDHDLACFKDNVEYTGKTAVDFLVDFCIDNDKKFPNWYVHTDNNSGRDNIIGRILNYINKVEGVNINNFRYFHRGIIDNQIL